MLTIAQRRSLPVLARLPRRVVTVYLPLAIFVFVLLFPFYWMAITSFKPNEELLSREGNPFWVIKPTLAHFHKLLFETSYPEWLWNTVIVSVVATFASLAAAVLAAYAIERLRFSGGRPSSSFPILRSERKSRLPSPRNAGARSPRDGS